jgi:hypothetical protein
MGWPSLAKILSQADEIREEATEEEISSGASLAKMCLLLRETDRPTMKEVE